MGSGGLSAQYLVLAITKNSAQVPLFFLPYEFIKKLPVLFTTLEMLFQHRMAAPISLPVSPRRAVLNAHGSACWVAQEALITA